MCAGKTSWEQRAGAGEKYRVCMSLRRFKGTLATVPAAGFLFGDGMSLARRLHLWDGMGWEGTAIGEREDPLGRLPCAEQDIRGPHVRTRIHATYSATSTVFPASHTSRTADRAPRRP